MLFKAKRGQVNYGEAIGILLLDTYTPFIPGDVGNATTYSYPVRYKMVKGLTVKKIFAKDKSLLDSFLKAGRELEREGVRAITGDCGFMAIFQEELKEKIKIPVFLTSLLQIPFISSIISKGSKVGVITANSRSLDKDLLNMIGIDDSIPVRITGLENKKNFYESVIKEVGTINPDLVKKEVVTTAEKIVKEDSGIEAILLECSCLPPYGKAVQKAVNLPVFDYITMINYVYMSVVKNNYKGFM